MRRLMGLAAILVIGSVSVGVPIADASPGQKPKHHQDRSLNQQVSGPFTGIQTFEFATGGCSFVHQVFESTYQTGHHKTGSLRIDVCVDLSESQFAMTGTFELTGPGRVVLHGSATGTTDGAAAVATYDLLLTVTDGTWHGKAVTGSLLLYGTWTNDPPGTFGHGPTSGVLAGALQRSRDRG